MLVVVNETKWSTIRNTPPKPLKPCTMEQTPFKKIVVSFLLTSGVIFSITAMNSMLGLFGKGLQLVPGSISFELYVFVQFCAAAFASACIHMVFYYGGLNSSPITKGVGSGLVVGLAYFALSMFVFNVYNINTDSLMTIAAGIGGSIFEYGSGGLLVAVVSLTEIHKWGLLRAI